MSYAPTNQSWYTPKNNAVPAHSGAMPQLYNPNSAQPQPPPVWNNGVQQPYWQSNPPTTSHPPRPPSVNQGSAHMAPDNSWSWGSQPQYQPQPLHQQGPQHHQQQQPQYNQPTQAPYHPNTDQYFYGNANTQPEPSSNSDPWNWGVEESSSSECLSNNNMDSNTDPTWNWSVDSTTAYQQQQQQQPPVHPTPLPQAQPGPSLQQAFSVSSSNSSYSTHEVSHQLETKHSSSSLSNRSEGSGTGHYENVNLQQTSSHQLQPVPPASHFGTESNNLVNDTRSNIQESVHSETPVYNNFEYHERLNTTAMTNQVTTHGTAELAIADTQSSIVSSIASEEVRLDNNGMDARTETEQFVHNELSVSSVMRHDRQVLAADGLLNELDFSVASKHSSTGLTPQWSTESLPSQGSDEVSHTLEGGSRYDFMPSPLSTVSQSPLLTDGGHYDQNQFDSYSSYHNTPSPAGVNGPMVDTNNITPVLSSGHGDEPYSSQMVDSLRHQMAHLNVNTNEPKLEDVDNKEIVPPESNASHPKEPTPPLVNSFMPPPPVPAPQSGPTPIQAPQSGPTPLQTPQPGLTPMQPPTSGPPKTMPVPAGNPYARSKTLLSHKSANKYRGTSQPAGSSEPSSFNATIMPPVSQEHPIEPPTPQALYDINVAEPAVGVDRSRASGTAEQEVNLETLPENKERPDVVESSLERKSMSPMNAPRTAAPAMVQDSNARQWAQPAAYSTSPENQEVAPRCGPDRNQYLETGQLSDDEEASEVSQYRNWSGLHSSDVSTPPPPGLRRMIPGRTEQDDNASSQERTVPGRGTNEDQAGFNMAAGEENPPPGLRRMVPGESSSPESQSQGVGSSQPGPASGNTFQPINSAPMEARVVTGVSREEVDGTDGQTNTAPTSNSRSPSPTPVQPSANKTQPTAERSETIGSDSVETTYPQPLADNTGRDISSGNRRDIPKDRDRRHREDEAIDDRDGRRRANHSYRERDRDRDREEEQEKRSHRTERDPHDRQGDGERDRRDGDRREGDRRDRHDVDGYDRKRKDRDRPKSNRERGRREESPESRRYREDRLRDKKRYDAREGYGNYRPGTDERRRFGRRTDYRDTDTGSEYSDYERRDYDRRGYDRRDYDRRDKPSYRGHEDYSSRYHDSRRHNRSHHDGSKLEGLDKSYRDKRDRRPESREHVATQFVPPRSGFHALNGRTIAEYLNYYTNLRSYDAIAYADWYNNVYKSLSYQQPISYSEDRGSVHSGRSSANSGVYRGDREIERATNSLTEDQSATSPHRLTPSKYSTAHVKGILTNRGQLIKILANYPLDGQQGIVEIHDIQGFMVSDKIKRELLNYPGPLVKGVTHKNSLVAFCNSKIKSAETNTDLFDRDSVVLLWKLLVLLLRQNGNVVGADIAELLLSNGQSLISAIPNRPSASSTPASLASRDEAQQEDLNVTSNNRAAFNVKSEEEITNSFREFLLYGNTKEALEWAMKNGLWGHALFLASKMDTRSYSNVMTRFANGLTMNDPLQTLYQLMSGRQPAAVTCCSDERWGDWRPHLAMILSNSSAQRLELTHKSITTLGDTLGSRGCLHAAHFTYLVAQVGFGMYSQKGAKLVLLGSSHHQPFEIFASNEAIQMTEIYEYARKLAELDYAIRPLQLYKLIYAYRLAEQGLVTEAMQYAEELGDVLLRHPEHYAMSLMRDVYDLGDRLKYNDPMYGSCTQDEAAEQEPPWLGRLKQVIGDIDSGVMQQDITSYGSVSNLSYTEGESFHHGAPSTDPLSQAQEPVSYDYNWQQQQLQQQQQQQQQQLYTPRMYLDPQQEQWQEHNQHQQQQQQQLDEKPNEMQDAFQPPAVGQSQPPQQEWPTSPQSISQWDTQGNSTMIGDNGQNQQQQQPYSNYWDQSNTHEELPAPQISLPNSMPERSQRTQDSDVQSKPSVKTNQKKDVPRANTGNGWFGGLWNKLALRPKNQMKLPDDKNPTIVWDSDRKRWTNLDADGEETSSEPPPPPKASSMMPNSIPSMPAPQSAPANHTSGEQSQPSSLPPQSAPNMYKMNRGRSLRSNYVDVLGGNKSNNQSLPAPPDMFPSMSTAPTQHMNFLVPGMSAGATESVPTEHMSSNAASNGSGEATSNQYDHSSTQGGEPQQPSYGGPLMFNPNNYAQPIPYAANPTTNQFKNRYPHK